MLGKVSVNRSGLDRTYDNAVAANTVPEGLEVGMEECLARVVNRLELTTTVTCDTADSNEAAVFGVGKSLSGLVTPSNRAHDVDIHHIHVLTKRVFVGLDFWHDSAVVDKEIEPA